MTTNHEVHLVRRPDGAPIESDFKIVEQPIGEPADGQVLVHNLFLSLDPAFRPALSAGQPLDAVVFGIGMGRVAKTRHAALKEGDLVSGMTGLQEYALVDGGQLTSIEPDPALPLSVYLGVLGMTGLTAYVGMVEIGKPRAGEVVFISTAAGAVGSIAAQIAKMRGCTVIGSTGSPEKAEWLKDDLNLDAVINYKQTPIAHALEAATPDGLDFYFDNVGGDQLDAALDRLKPHGRVAVCGMIAAYDQAGAHTTVRNMFKVIANRLTITGFSLQDWGHARADFNPLMTDWLKSGRIRYRETIFDGIDKAPAAFAGIMRGDNIGKMLVKLG